jgi:hypothetical protein
MNDYMVVPVPSGEFDGAFVLVMGWALVPGMCMPVPIPVSAWFEPISDEI